MTTVFNHVHPYPIFIPPGCRALIIGTLPPPRFTTRELNPGDVDFCYGSSDGMLWPVLDAIFDLRLRYDNSPEAVAERKAFLAQQKLGICDIVASCIREKIDASDLGMKEIRLRNIFHQLDSNPDITRLIFTGGASKNGPEYLFRRQCRQHGITLACIDQDTPRRHRFSYQDRCIATVSLTSPSKAANRAIGSHPLYKERRNRNPDYSPFDFRCDQYREVFAGR